VPGPTLSGGSIPGADATVGSQVGVEECRPIELPVREDPYGDLAFAEGNKHVPFPIARVFFVYGVPGSAIRGGHAHLELEEAIFCLKGRMDVKLDDGRAQRTFTLVQPRVGIYLPPMMWHDLESFSPGTVYLVLTSAPYDEAHYIRDRDEYLAMVRAPAPSS
jgi:oxalate decarboxylase/phosphoglucose isomerase-like protein (cupin superfamily)